MARISRIREARLRGELGLLSDEYGTYNVPPRGAGLHSSRRIGQIPAGAMSTFQVISMLTIPLAIIGLISAGRRPGAYLEVGRR